MIRFAVHSITGYIIWKIYYKTGEWKEMIDYFEQTIKILTDSLNKISSCEFYKLLDTCENTLKSGNKIIVSGLGKNVSICDKFVGTMLSLGLNANFLHTNSAIHGDLGMVRENDLVIILSKSGSTTESVYLVKALKKKKCFMWLLTFSENGILSQQIENKLVISLEHEGDMWNIIPNNSTILNLIVLQTLALKLAERMCIRLEDFAINHPGGAIGALLQ